MEVYSFFILPIVLGVIIIPICGVFLFLIFKNLKKKKAVGHLYIPFYIENGQFIMNCFFLKKFLLSDISYVMIGVFKPFGGQFRTAGRHSAYIRIVKTDGTKSRKFNFDSSIYTKRINFFHLDSDLLESIKIIEKELKAESIHYIVLGKEKLSKF